MPFPAEPCPQCPRVAKALPLPCPAMARNVPRLCALVALGRADYAALLCRDWPEAGANPTAEDREARVPLGERPPAAPGGD